MKLYEPLRVLKPVASDLWVVDGPTVSMKIAALSAAFPTRMVIARLPDASLWVWSPIEPSADLSMHVDALGPVRHLVSPNKLHYVHLAAWKARYPAATVWASPGVRERAARKHVPVTFDVALADTPGAPWASELDQLVFRGSCMLEEVVFFHRASRTVVVADLIENFEPGKLTFLERALMRLGGVSDPDGKTPGDFRVTFLGHRDVARACLARMLAWNPERVVIAHGRWYEREGAAEIRRAFRWLD